ncbi:hypothetical protein CRG98_050313 [Punica granatum]|uniref:Uncharacterized protein n=1 Tax=Punica granatum TaxID=22663 RepID=A0A2I0GJH1_PUNGR|nr:hypothetical protein CRG98_050313 [Punica granatum]
MVTTSFGGAGERNDVAVQLGEGSGARTASFWAVSTYEVVTINNKYRLIGYTYYFLVVSTPSL